MNPDPSLRHAWLRAGSSCPCPPALCSPASCSAQRLVSRSPARSPRSPARFPRLTMQLGPPGSASLQSLRAAESFHRSTELRRAVAGLDRSSGHLLAQPAAARATAAPAQHRCTSAVPGVLNARLSGSQPLPLFTGAAATRVRMHLQSSSLAGGAARLRAQPRRASSAGLRQRGSGRVRPEPWWRAFFLTRVWAEARRWRLP